MKTLQAKHLTIGYSASQPVLRDLSFSLPESRLTCIIGDNGVGKSTLLRTITGALKPLGGSIFLGDDDLTLLDASARARIWSLVLTDRIDDSLMTVRELVAMGRMPYTGFFGGLSESDNRIIDESISMLNISGIAPRPISQISDGQRQRALIAKALAQQTPVMILDEPTAFLDFRSKIELMRLLKNLAAQGKTILMTTHDLDLAMRFADWFWVIESGRISEGTPQQCAHLLPQL